MDLSMRLVGPLPDFLMRCAARFREERCAQAAASLAFTTLLALVPLLTVALVLISHFDLFSGLGTALRNFLLANLLPEKAGKVIASLRPAIQPEDRPADAARHGMLVLTALLLMLSIDRVFGQIWRVSSRVRCSSGSSLSGRPGARARRAGRLRGGGDLSHDGLAGAGQRAEMDDQPAPENPCRRCCWPPCAA
jgi:uncharacterized BrkB/YihY/UPF0761 family membrane protein